MPEDVVVPTENQRAARVAQFIEFDDVFLLKHSAELLEDKGTILTSKNLEVSVRYEPSCPYTFDATSNVIAVRPAFLFELMRKADDANPPTAAVRVASVFVLNYVFHVTEPPTGQELGEHLSAFANVNARFNAWPYFREIVQSSVARMGLPPVVLPVFRVKRQASKEVPALEGEPSKAPKARRRTTHRERG